MITMLILGVLALIVSLIPYLSIEILLMALMPLISGDNAMGVLAIVVIGTITSEARMSNPAFTGLRVVTATSGYDASSALLIRISSLIGGIIASLGIIVMDQGVSHMWITPLMMVIFILVQCWGRAEMIGLAVITTIFLWFLHSQPHATTILGMGGYVMASLMCPARRKAEDCETGGNALGLVMSLGTFFVIGLPVAAAAPDGKTESYLEAVVRGISLGLVMLGNSSGRDAMSSYLALTDVDQFHWPAFVGAVVLMTPLFLSAYWLTIWMIRSAMWQRWLNAGPTRLINLGVTAAALLVLMASAHVSIVFLAGAVCLGLMYMVGELSGVDKMLPFPILIVVSYISQWGS
ncbi:hypothetical protein AVV41_gp058 [Microcystis phage MaMV-DC]|uniref:Uncharacterized protein n=1 Tax=Microcystis phage MaMV-DC TaxID=1357715 RepID=A0A075BSL6_9CAUD|nr:hypothetical protein AVV41_gp058 [Microcystis phage MaMV-DC]AGR48623.1 hypothetical protein MaMVDC_58 [Microcystis phage MaMV-DC]